MTAKRPPNPITVRYESKSIRLMGTRMPLAELRRIRDWLNRCIEHREEEREAKERRDPNLRLRAHMDVLLRDWCTLMNGQTMEIFVATSSVPQAWLDALPEVAPEIRPYRLHLRSVGSQLRTAREMRDRFQAERR